MFDDISDFFGFNSAGETGTTAQGVRPEMGTVLDFLEEEKAVEPHNGNSFWKILDDLKEPIAGALGTVVNAYGEKVANAQSNGAEAAFDSRGLIADQNLQNAPVQTLSFFDRNKTMIIGGLAAAGLLTVVLLVKK
jgi:hypothetical protein